MSTIQESHMTNDMNIVPKVADVPLRYSMKLPALIKHVNNTDTSQVPTHLYYKILTAVYSTARRCVSTCLPC